MERVLAGHDNSPIREGTAHTDSPKLTRTMIHNITNTQSGGFHLQSTTLDQARTELKAKSPTREAPSLRRQRPGLQKDRRKSVTNIGAGEYQVTTR